MTSTPDQIRRKAERALHQAALAINRGDFEAKKKHNEEAEFLNGLLKAAGEDPVQVDAIPFAERCSETEDLFS